MVHPTANCCVPEVVVPGTTLTAKPRLSFDSKSPVARRTAREGGAAKTLGVSRREYDSSALTVEVFVVYAFGL